MSEHNIILLKIVFKINVHVLLSFVDCVFVYCIMLLLIYSYQLSI